MDLCAETPWSFGIFHRAFGDGQKYRPRAWVEEDGGHEDGEGKRSFVAALLRMTALRA